MEKYLLQNDHIYYCGILFLIIYQHLKLSCLCIFCLNPLDWEFCGSKGFDYLIHLYFLYLEPVLEHIVGSDPVV